MIPGECFNKPIVEYLQFARMFNERFPGFDTDIHGLVEVKEGGVRKYYVDCVRPRAGRNGQAVGASTSVNAQTKSDPVSDYAIHP